MEADRSSCDELYALQDRVLARIRRLEQRLYLTGGTALSRGYCGHRYSEDLDFLANDASEFGLWRDRCLAAIEAASHEEQSHLEIPTRDERFGRAVVQASQFLKLEFANDVPFHVGQPTEHPTLGLLDTRENILANKVTALVDRCAPKDAADIYWLCCVEGLSLPAALEGASGKAAGVFPPLVAEALERGRLLGVPELFRIRRPDPARFDEGMRDLVASLMP
jgi:hypothetical protein